MARLINNDVLYESGAPLVFLRNEFYKLTFHRLMMTFIVSIIFNAVMFVIVMWLWRANTPPVYFATDPAGNVLIDAPLTMPLLSDTEVSAFAVKAARSVVSFNYLSNSRIT